MIAPVTGKYRFWVSGGTSVELWLSTDEMPFSKRRIARVGPEVGIAHGISNVDNPDFDFYTSQQSIDLDLVAGQSYFIEILQQTSSYIAYAHIGVAWAYNGGPRTPIPFELMATYAPGAEDLDDDALPDAWETAMGLDASNNGLTDRLRQGDRGDYDSDALTNREEWLAGTNPTLKDSDADGISDHDEVKIFRSNPNATNSAWENEVQTLDIHAPAASSMTWGSFGDGVIGERFRGSISFDLNFPQNGKNWLVSIRGKIIGQTAATETMPLKISIDDLELGRQDFTCSLGEEGSLRVLTPRLTAGTHRVKIFVDNMQSAKSFVLLGLEVLRPKGDDLDADGLPDWLAGMALENAWPTPELVETFVSPYCLEGGSRFNGCLSLKVEGVITPTLPATSDKTWFADVPLALTGRTVMSGRYDGRDRFSTRVSWEAFEVGSAAQLDLRVGDTLKFRAPAGVGASVSYQILPGTWSAQAAHPVKQYHTFASPGTFTLTATRADGTLASTTCVVHHASAAETLVLSTERARIFDLTGVPANLKLEVVEPLRFTRQDVTSGLAGSRLRMECTADGNYGLLARLPGGGPIVKRLPVHVTAHASASSGVYQVIGHSALEGYMDIAVPLVITSLPPGYTARIIIVRAGVIFPDGTTVMDLTSADLIDGQYMMHFLFPTNIPGGYCHIVEILDPQGQVIADY